MTKRTRRIYNAELQLDRLNWFSTKTGYATVYQDPMIFGSNKSAKIKNLTNKKSIRIVNRDSTINYGVLCDERYLCKSEHSNFYFDQTRIGPRKRFRCIIKSLISSSPSTNYQDTTDT